MRQLSTNKWLITNSDKGTILLLKGLVEKKVTTLEVGKVYVTSKDGDFLEDAPEEERYFDRDDDDDEDF